MMQELIGWVLLVVKVFNIMSYLSKKLLTIPNKVLGSLYWKLTPMYIAGANWIGVTYGNGRFVAVSKSDTIGAYSDNGINWYYFNFPEPPSIFDNYSCIAYGGGKFVVTGAQFAHSADGITWVAGPSTIGYNNITYGEGKFVVIAQSSNQAAYSNNGITWIATTLPSFSGWNALAYGGGRFVAIAVDDSTAAYSNDGVTWVAATMPSSQSWRSVTYGGGRFVAIASDTNVAAYSNDGITWIAMTLPSSSFWMAVTYGGVQFFALSYTENKGAYSNNGITWTQFTMPGGKWVQATYGENRFVAVADFSSQSAFTI
jgi:hypothetical protein